MKTKFTNFFNYLFSLLVVLTLSLGNAWGDETFTFSWTSAGTAGYSYSQAGPTGGSLLTNNAIYFLSNEGPKVDASKLNPYRVGFVFKPTANVTLKIKCSAGSSARTIQNIKIDEEIDARFYSLCKDAVGASKTVMQYALDNATSDDKAFYATVGILKVSKGVYSVAGDAKSASGQTAQASLYSARQSANNISVPASGNNEVTLNTGSPASDYTFQAGKCYRVYTEVSSSTGAQVVSFTFAASGGGSTPSATPTISAHPSTSAAQYIKDAAATDLSVTASNGGSGTLTYQWYSNTTASNTSGTVLTNCTTSTYTPSTASTGTLYYYCAVTNTEEGKTATTVKSNVSGAISVILNPLGSHTLTWNLTVRESSSGESTLGTATTDIGTASKNSTSTYITNQTDLTGVGVKRTTDGKSNNTGKIETPTSYDADKYVSFTFDVADGYQFTPSAVSIKTVAVSTAKDLKFEFSDANGSYSVTKTNLSTSGTAATNELDFSASDVDFTGTVTVKIYVYGAENQYRLSTPLTITGTVASTAVPSGYAIATSATNGSIAVTDGSSAISSADEDDVVYIAATPNTGYGFTSWDIYKTSDATIKVSLLADDDSDNKTRKFSMPAYPVTVGATFTAIDYTVTHSAASNGSYTIKVGDAPAVSTNTTANYGQTVTLAATPNTGYTFAGWTVLQGETPVSVTNNAFTMPAGNVTISASFDEITCPTEGSVYSLNGWKTSNSSTWTTANNSSEQITGLGTLIGGAAYAVSIEASKVPQKDNDGKDNMAYKLGYNSVALRCALDCPLQEGDLITIVSSDSHSNAFILTKANSRSNAETTSCTSGTNTYTVKSNDKIVGSTDLYIWRNSSTLNIMTVSITRPEKFDVTYHKNDGSGTSTLAENVSVVAANEFSRSGYRFIEWNTQADGKGTTKAVGAAVTADIELYAIWSQEYSVSYANTGAASGAAPTNENKYIAGETFKVAGVGSMVAATNYSFGGWNDGSNTYAENDNYTVSSANVSFSPVWVLSYNVTYKANGGTKASGAAATDIVANNPSTIAQCQFLPADGKVFTKWNTQADGEGVDYLPGASISTAVELYAQYETVSCDARQSITKAVLTSASAATTSGYNDKEYAGDAKINGLGGGGGTAVADLGEGEVTGYKLAGQKSILFATLAKGSFQAGDQLVIGITKASEGAGQQLEIYAGSDKDNVLKVINLDNISAAGYYKYTLTATDATAINAAGYKGIGLYRSQGTGGQNPFVYSVEVTGCRSWSIYHTLTFKNADGSATIASESLAEGAYASTVAPADPRIKGKRFLGWSESVDGDVVNLAEYTITEDKILYIVYEDVDCPTSGTIYKFQLKTGLADETLGISDNKDMSEYVNASGDGYLTYTSSANNYATITNDSLIQMKNATAYLKADLDCALAAGDRIRVRCYNNPINVQVGTSYDSSKDLNFAKNDFGWQDITASMVGKSDLYITRASNGNANLAYVEIYRRPALTGVTMDNMRLKVSQSGTPVLHLLPNDEAFISSQAWEITASTATGTTINASTGLITAGETPGEMTVQVTLNGDKVASATVAIVRGFEAPVPVTTSTVWDWSSLSVASGDGPTIASPDTVLANYLSGAGWENLAGNNNGRPYRSSTYKAYQGTSLYFKAAVPGELTINGTYTSNNKKVYVNGIEVGTVTGTRADLNPIVVSAGDVYITSDAMRIYSMTFDTNLNPSEAEESTLGGYEREVNPQYYGTICLPKAGVMTGATLFQIAYMDYKSDGVTPYKVYYDEVENGTMQAGMPYIFLAEQSTIGVYYTGTTAVAQEDLLTYHGLHGTLENMVDMSGEGIYMLYNNKVLHSTNPESYLNANRAYIQISEIPGYNNPGYMAPAPKGRRISTSINGKNAPTGLDEITNDQLPMTDKLFINGQLFILRGEKLYDATGRLVK